MGRSPKESLRTAVLKKCHRSKRGPHNKKSQLGAKASCCSSVTAASLCIYMLPHLPTKFAQAMLGLYSLNDLRF